MLRPSGADAVGDAVAGERDEIQKPMTAMAAVIATPVASPIKWLRRENVFEPALVAAASAGCSAIHFSCNATSRALCHRPSGSFSRQRATTHSRVGGVTGDNSLILRGSVARM